MSFTPQQFSPPPVPPPKASNTVGVVGFVFAVFGIVLALPGVGFSYLLVIVAFVLCLIGLARAGNVGGSGKGLSIAGVVLSVLGLVFMVGHSAAAFQSGYNAGLGAPTEPSVDAQPSGDGTNPVPDVTQPTTSEVPKATSFTYKVTGNYRATQIHYTGSNGDSVDVNDTGNINTAGSKLPWSMTVTPEPNGKGQLLDASTLSSKGDSIIECSILDNTGRVVADEVGRGAYASCTADTPYTSN